MIPLPDIGRTLPYRAYVKYSSTCWNFDNPCVETDAARVLGAHETAGMMCACVA
jgi:hypothetical protein